MSAVCEVSVVLGKFTLFSADLDNATVQVVGKQVVTDYV